MSGRVDLGYELNGALSAFLDESGIIRKQQAKVKMLEMLWDNKAGIIAHLLSGPAWLPIETYDPAHELNVLVVDQGVVSEAYYDGESDTWFKEGKSEHDFDFVDSDRLFPTHWMPMPEAPSVPQADRGGAT